MKTTKLNKAYTKFKEELYRKKIEADKEYRKNRSGLNYDAVVKLSQMLETLKSFESDIEEL